MSASDDAQGQAVCRPWDSAHTDACAHIGEGGGRDRFSTIEKRRCDCAGGRALSARVSASDDAPGQAVCRLARFILGLQLAPVACTHECNFHLSTLMRTQSVRDSSRRTISMDSGRLTRECRACATCRTYTHPTGHVHLLQRSRTLPSKDEETACLVSLPLHARHSGAPV